MKLLIYGGGAVGLGIASCLIKSGHDLDIVARDDTAALLNREGLKRAGIFGDFSAPPASFGAFSSPGNIKSGGYDYLLVCTKAHDSEGAAKDLAAHPDVAGKGAKIVLFQNGWGSADFFVERFGEERVFSARVITGFIRPEKNVVEITVHADAIRMGSLFGEDPAGLADLGQAISEGGIPCALSEDVGKDLWAKMLYNCALNALGAIFEVPYGVLGEDEGARDIMWKLVEEVFLVMEAWGHETHWETPEKYMDAFYGELLPPTKRHESSMLQDIRMGKKTEIGFLNGAVIRLASIKGVRAPANGVIAGMVGFLEGRSKGK